MRHGAVIVRRGQVVARGWNQRSSGDVGDTGSWRTSHIHAEMAAIKAAGSKAHGSTLIVVRILADGTIAYSAPCARCRSVIHKSGIRAVVHS